MKLFISMSEFDRKMKSLWSQYGSSVSYDDFISSIAKELGLMPNAFRQASKQVSRYDKVEGLKENLVKVEQAVIKLGYSKDILTWRLDILGESVNIADVPTRFKELKESIDKLKSNNLSDLLKCFEGISNQSKFLYLPASMIREYNLDLEYCNDYGQEVFWKSLNAESDENIVQYIFESIVKINNETVFKHMKKVIKSNPSHYFYLLPIAHEQFLLYMIDDNSGKSLTKDQKNQVLTDIFSSLFKVIGYGEKINPDNALNLSRCSSKYAKSMTTDNHWEKNEHYKNLDIFEKAIEYSKYETVSSDNYLTSILFSILVSGNKELFSLGFKEFSSHLSKKQLKYISQINQFLQSDTEDVIDNDYSDNLLLEKSVRYVVFNSKPENHMQFKRIIKELRKSVKNNELEGIDRVISNLTPSLESVLFQSFESYGIVLDEIEPLINKVIDNEDLLYSVWKFACFTKKRSWIDALKDHVSEEIKGYMQIYNTNCFNDLIDELGEERVNEEFCKARNEIDNIINPNRHWFKDYDVYSETPKMLAYFYTLNEMIIEKKDLKRGSTLEANKRLIFDSQTQEDLRFLNSAPSGSSCENRINLYLTLKMIPSYSDLKVGSDGNFLYLYSEKLSEIIFVTSVGLDRLVKIAENIGMSKLSFVYSGYKEFQFSSIYIPPVMISESCRDIAFDYYVMRDVLSMIDSSETDIKTNALKNALELHNMEFDLHGMTFGFDFSGNVNFCRLNEN